MLTATLSLVLIGVLAMNTALLHHKQKDVAIKKQLEQQSELVTQLQKENAILKKKPASHPHYRVDHVRVENLNASKSHKA